MYYCYTQEFMMNLNRAALKKLVIEELDKSLREAWSGPGLDHENILKPEEIMRLVNAGIDVAGINRTNLTDQMKSILGMEPDSSIGSETSSRNSAPISTKQILDEIVELLIERGAVKFGGEYDDDVYQDALDYTRDTIVPALIDLAARGAYDRK